jgi:hypothetical protein
MMSHTTTPDTRARHAVATVALLATGFTLSAATVADPIDDFDIADGPTFEVDELEIGYDSGVDLLSIDGTGRSSAGLDLGDGNLFSIDGTGFNIILSIDGTGRLNSGTFQLIGDVDELELSGVLLEGEATGFGFVPGEEEFGPQPLPPELFSDGLGDDEFQVIFDITGGQAANLFGESLALLLFNTGFAGSFDDDFMNNGSGGTFAGTAVPAPATPLLLLIGAAAFGLRHPRRPRVNG